MKRIVVTGGTHAGKSSIVELFKKNGFTVVPDVGLEIISELNNTLGQEAQRKFRAKNPLKFYSKIIKKQLTYENEIKSDIIIFDRGVYDYIAMLKLKHISVPESLTKNLKSYDLVFVFDSLSHFDERKSSGRSLTQEDSLRLRNLVKEIYENAGCKVILVKEMPLQQRYEFIKNHL